ncbi:MAG: phosphodiester glycosidase family protein [Muribaculaceae bacterium]|nr:phosphodiester glycosidase family protein [Muribaculaceae bacterium]
MRKLLFAMIAALPFTGLAATQWTLKGNTYAVDTLFHVQIGPGTTQTSVKATGAYDLNIFYTTTDLTNPYVDMRAVMASDKIVSVATVSSMASAHNAEGALYFAGVNADFFGGSAPIGTTAVDGEVYYAANNGWTHWAYDENKKPYIGQMLIGGTVKNAAGTFEHAITSVNAYRGENNLVIYTPKYGSTTGTNSYGTEVVLTPVEGSIALGKAVKMKVTGAPSAAGSMAIPAGGYVLSGHGTAATFVSSLADGDVITVNATLKLDGNSIVATQVLGGQPTILKDGVVLDTETNPVIDHLPSLNPRTAVGHDASGTKLVMLVVDGRGASDGCTTMVLADIMREVGCSVAMNFDGGGSSALYTDALGVRNDPSDGKERAVTNALFAVATSPSDNEIAAISFVDYNIKLPKYGYYTPVIYGYNKYGVLIDTNVQGYTLSCPDGLGEVVNNGASLFASGEGYHGLTATIGNATATVPVTIGTGEPHFRLDNVLVDSYTDYAVEVTASVDGLEMPLDNGALTWKSEDDAVATVDASGKVHGVKNGTTKVIGTVDGISDTIAVTVEIPESRYKALDPNLDITTWTFAKGAVKDAALTALGTEGFAFDYTVSSTRATYVRATKNITMWSLPDSLQFKINPGDAKIKNMTVSVKAGASGRSSWIEFTPAFAASVVNDYKIAISELVAADDMASYPVTIGGVTFNLGDASGTTHRIEVHAINGVYAAVAPGVGGIETIAVDKKQEIVISPNPVNAGEAVVANVDARYEVYSINGVLMTSGRGREIFTDRLTSGVYIVRFSGNDVAGVARLIVK